MNDELNKGNEQEDITKDESTDLKRARNLLEEENDEAPSSAHSAQQRDADIEELIVLMKKRLKKWPFCWSEREQKRQADLLCDLGHAYYKLCKFNIARNYYEKYYESVKKLESSHFLQRAYCNLGCVYRRLGDFDKATEFLEKGLEISEELKDQRSQGRLLNNLGNIYEMKMDFETALHYHLRRRRLARRIKDGDVEAKAHASLANAYHCLGDIRRSIAFYEKVIIWLKRKLGKEETRFNSTISRLTLSIFFFSCQRRAISDRLIFRMKQE